MQPAARAASMTGGKSFSSRAMSRLASKQRLQGAKWDYEIIGPLIGDGTHRSTIFKALVLPKNKAVNDPTWAVIKTASPDDNTARQDLKREYDVYCLPGIATSPYFRKMYDVIGNTKNFVNGGSEPVPSLALEWMDLTLAQLPYANSMRSYTIMNAVLETMMSSLVVLDSQHNVNTDTKPANILLSGIDTGHPIVKIGDLGLGIQAPLDLTRIPANAPLVHLEGSRCLAQPLAMRAPEVYEGRPCVHRSQIWACAAMLLCWMKPGILGPAGSIHAYFHEAWCIAKIRRLFPDWTPSPVKDDVLEAEFKLSKGLISDPPPSITEILPLEDELRTVDMLPEVRDLLRYLFVVNLEKRPSASEVLASKEYQALVEKTRAIH